MMSQHHYYDQQQAPVTAYPPPAYYAATAPQGQAPMMQPLPQPPQANDYVQPTPPPGYPGSFNVAAMNPPPPQVVAPQTQSRGDKAFWEGCCAALCCCCLLDMCC